MPNTKSRPNYLRSTPVVTKKKPKAKRRLLLLCLVVIGVFLLAHTSHTSDTTKLSSSNNIKNTPVATKSTATNQANHSTASQVNYCSANTLDKFVLVSISQRHLWACDLTTQVYDSPVITGMDFLTADLTPPGTYHIYGKVTNTVLTGQDSTGSWNDPVSYWMPFLDNQYGQYGFHDATWRPNSEFGNVSPNSPNASHGCVECPLQTAAWLYNWAPIGTTVTIQS